MQQELFSFFIFAQRQGSAGGLVAKRWTRTGQIMELASFFSKGSFATMSSKEKGGSSMKPEPYKAVRVWLEDGSRIHGMWMETTWWSTKGEISPVKWELEERPKKTRKIAETLPGPSL